MNDLFATVSVLVRPGNTVWDIGANVGLFSFASAALAGPSGRVVAFEPDTELVALLRKTARELPAHVASVTVVPAGVAGATALRTFSIASRARASNALSEYGNSAMGGTREVQTIVCIAIDEYRAWLPSPDVVKIDVEGAEVEVLTGASRLLEETAPAIACEVAPQNAERVTEVLRSFGYCLFDAAQPLRVELEVNLATWNTIALHKHRLGHFFPTPV